jgi:chaperonin GroES
MTESLRPLWGNVCLKLDPPDEKTEGGLWIPEPTREQKLSGTVMAVGAGRIDVDGVFHPTDLKPGDKVMFGRYLGYRVPVEGEKYYMCMEKHISAVVGEQEELAVLEEFDQSIHWEYLYVDIPNWQSGDNLGYVQDFQSVQWIPHMVVKGTNTLRYFRRDSVKYWQEYHREQESMREVFNNPIFEKAGMVSTKENPLQPMMDILQNVDLGPTDNQAYEYKIINIVLYESEPNSPEQAEYERYQKAGWEIHEADINVDCMRITSLRRVVK